VSTIVAAAALAHDLGNPPFGHSGEAAIQYWATRRLPKADALPAAHSKSGKINVTPFPMSDEQIADFLRFEGNAQGLRLLLRTAARTRKGGLRPTLATVGALVKYPRPSAVHEYTFDNKKVSEKKPGYFQSERTMAIRAFQNVGMIERTRGVFCRHPLAFLTEAADDVCYAIADLEDGFKVGALNFQETRDVLLPLASADQGFSEVTYVGHSARVDRMRASALAVLAKACVQAFRDNLEALEEGTLAKSLVELTPVSQQYESVKDLAKQKVYSHERVLQIEYAGFQTLGGLLDMFYSALCDPQHMKKDDKLRKLLPVGFLFRPGRKNVFEGKEPMEAALQSMTPYERMLAVTDYVSGMTDGFAVQLFQRLSGIRLPG
jgi:dGTPase